MLKFIHAEHLKDAPRAKRIVHQSAGTGSSPHQGILHQCLQRTRRFRRRKSAPKRTLNVSRHNLRKPKPSKRSSRVQWLLRGQLIRQRLRRVRHRLEFDGLHITAHDRPPPPRIRLPRHERSDEPAAASSPHERRAGLRSDWDRLRLNVRPPNALSLSSTPTIMHSPPILPPFFNRFSVFNLLAVRL
jgi:hypothetical protein